MKEMVAAAVAERVHVKWRWDTADRFAGLPVSPDVLPRNPMAVELSAGKRLRRHFTPAFHLLWVAVSKLVEGWEDLVHLRSPWQNPSVERMVGILRRELLDHVLVLNQRHLARLLRQYLAQYYHIARPHQGLGGATPSPSTMAREGELIAVPVLGGLHDRYYRAAA